MNTLSYALSFVILGLSFDPDFCVTREDAHYYVCPASSVAGVLRFVNVTSRMIRAAQSPITGIETGMFSTYFYFQDGASGARGSFF